MIGKWPFKEVSVLIPGTCEYMRLLYDFVEVVKDLEVGKSSWIF